MSDWNAELNVKQLLEDQNGLLQMLLIQQMRLYDALLTSVRLQDEKTADTLLSLHQEFKYIGPLPYTEE
jgi:hypothetical protein